MAVKIRLARKGRKKLAFYHVVVADSRSPRDGRYIEKIGSYNPVTNPATIELDFDKALGWLQNGALPTDTCRAILSYKGVMIKKHLLEGVKKGAFDEAEATRRFDEWIKQNEAKIEAKKSNLEKSQDDELGKRLKEQQNLPRETPIWQLKQLQVTKLLLLKFWAKKKLLLKKQLRRRSLMQLHQRL
jgi:small subunit ribosomal protein S16